MSDLGASSRDPHAWHAFGGREELSIRLGRLAQSPPWRDFATRKRVLAEKYQFSTNELDAVNAALYLRRPLLITGPPGSGKSSLAYAVANDLSLGDVLRWPVNSRSTLTEGLYSYDAIARLRDVEVERGRKRPRLGGSHEDIGRYLRLNALGTALYGVEQGQVSYKPRVLLIDEIDKSDIDLPNDLLHVLEEGEFEIPELARLAYYGGHDSVEVETADPVSPGRPRRRVLIANGVVRCTAFPFVLITSNGERDLPPAFFRRCLRLDLPQEAKAEHLKRIVNAHLGDVEPDLLALVVNQFIDKQRARELVANDQLLNVLYLIIHGKLSDDTQRNALIDLLLRELNR